MDLEQFLQQLNGNYEDWKSSIEQRFSCVVCLAPKFKMVYGLCQHRICVGCGYEVNGSLKQAFYRCPTCQLENVFPVSQPSIPEDNITAQKLCGVRVCKYKGCSQELWEWEKDEHELYCPSRVSPKCVHVHHYKDKYSSVTPKCRNVTRRYSLRQSNKQDSKVYCSAKQNKSQSRYDFRSQRNGEPSH